MARRAEKSAASRAMKKTSAARNANAVSTDADADKTVLARLTSRAGEMIVKICWTLVGSTPNCWATPPTQRASSLNLPAFSETMMANRARARYTQAPRKMITP